MTPIFLFLLFILCIILIRGLLTLIARVYPDSKKIGLKLVGWLALLLGALILLWLIATGKLHFAFAVVLGVIAWLFKMSNLIALARFWRMYIPLWAIFRAGIFRNRARTNQTRAASGGMTVQEAAKALGVSTTANRKQVIAAWRNKMRKAHPDVGGSETKAKKLNQALDVMLRDRK